MSVADPDAGFDLQQLEKVLKRSKFMHFYELIPKLLGPSLKNAELFAVYTKAAQLSAACGGPPSDGFTPESLPDVNIQRCDGIHAEVLKCEFGDVALSRIVRQDDIVVGEGNRVWPGNPGDLFPNPTPRIRADLCVYTKQVCKAEESATKRLEMMRVSQTEAMGSVISEYLRDPIVDCPQQRNGYSVTSIGLLRTGVSQSNIAVVALSAHFLDLMGCASMTIFKTHRGDNDLESIASTIAPMLWMQFGDKRQRGKSKSVDRDIDGLRFDCTLLHFLPLSLRLANVFDAAKDAHDEDAMECVLQAIQLMFLHLGYRFKGAITKDNNRDAAACFWIGMRQTGSRVQMHEWDAHLVARGGILHERDSATHEYVDLDIPDSGKRGNSLLDLSEGWSKLGSSPLWKVGLSPPPPHLQDHVWRSASISYYSNIRNNPYAPLCSVDESSPLCGH